MLLNKVEVSRVGRRDRFILVLSLAVAVASAVWKWNWDRQHQDTRIALVAARDLEAYETIEPKDVQLRRLPRDAVQPGAFQSPEQVIGRLVRIPLLQGEQFVPQKLFAAGDARQLMDDRAIGIRTDLALAAGGTVRKGDRVDLYWVPERGSTLLGRQIAAGLLVLDVRTSSGLPAEPDQGTPAVVVLKVPAGQVLEIADSAQRGDLVLARHFR